MPKHANPFAKRVDALEEGDFALLQEAVETRRCRESVGVGNYDEAADKWRPRPPCPKCGSSAIARRGRTGAGHRFWECRDCGRKYTSLAGTIFESFKKPLFTWVLFIRLMCYNVQLDAAAELCGMSHQTAWEWRHRVMETISGYQDRIVLRDRVWIDEMYVTDSDLKGEPGWRPKRGLSKDKICIAVAIDVHKNVVAVRCGHGKPSAKRIKDALQARIAEGSEIFHDMEKSHKSLVKAVKGVDRPYKADTEVLNEWNEPNLTDNEILERCNEKAVEYLDRLGEEWLPIWMG